ncbi:hypothetical protein ACH5RR_008511 [Cinchona calisaya]|uniref:Uncharacterized protein n=1 Tax=Cinchona calisaya TaxID=153742 RepID=A0ABD3ADC1_9GENT
MSDILCRRNGTFQFGNEEDDNRFRDLEETATESSNLEENFAMYYPDPDDNIEASSASTKLLPICASSYSHFGWAWNCKKSDEEWRNFGSVLKIHFTEVLLQITISNSKSQFGT